jgi:YihY family inner membrane protein
MDVLRPVRAFDRVQQRHRWLAVPMAVVKKFGDDQGGSLAALVAYYAFFSLFPLLLVMTTILGFVFQHNLSAQHSIEKSVLGQFPVVNQTIKLHALTGKVSSLVIGLVTSLLGGLGVTGATQNAFDRVWAVPFKHRPDFLKSRLRGLALITVLGLLFIVATGVTGFTSGIHGPAGKVGAVLVGFAVNFLLFLAAFRFMTSAVVPMRCLWIGVTVAAVFWEILQYFGGYYVNHVLRHTSPLGAQFATVIALIVFLHLGAQVTLYAAEVNVVLARRLWPRSLMGPPSAPADEATLTGLAKVEERSEHELIDVEFRTDGPEAQAAGHDAGGPDPESTDPAAAARDPAREPRDRA